MIKTNKTFTSLALSLDEINVNGVRLVVHFVENYHRTLEFFNYSYKMLFTDESIDSPLQMIEHNQSLRRLFVHPSH